MPNTSAPLEHRVRLGGPEELITAIPYLLGFHPRESVVAVGLRGRRSRVCLTLRFDLPGGHRDVRAAEGGPRVGVAAEGEAATAVNGLREAAAAEGGPGEAAAAGGAAREAVTVEGGAATAEAGSRDAAPALSGAVLADLIVGQLRRGGAQQAVVLVLTEEGDAPVPRRELAAALNSSLRRARIGVRDLLCVRGGRWWSYLCEEPACCPPEGRPVPDAAPDTLVAAMVVEGRVVHAGRDELAATVATAPRDDEAGWLRCFAAAEEQHRQRAVPAIARHTVLGEIEVAVRAKAEASHQLSDEDIARFCVALAESELRDACLRWLDGSLADAAESLWRELARAAVRPYAAAPATLLGLHAYARGDGTLAQMCLDRALADDPVYTLALLVREGLAEGIPPAEIRKLAACVEEAEADT